MTTLMHPVRWAYGRKREVMPSHLPHSPSLRHLRKQARDLQRADPVALRLQAAQHTVAVSYGFRTWAELKHFVLALNRSAGLVARYTGLPNREFDVLRRSGRVVPSVLVPRLTHDGVSVCGRDETPCEIAVPHGQLCDQVSCVLKKLPSQRRIARDLR